MKDFIAHTSIGLGFEGFEHEFDARITFTVTPGRPQTRLEPEEFPSVEINKVEVKLGSRWHEAEGTLHDMIICHTVEGDGLDEWLLKEAAEAEEAAQDDAADHRRQMLREDAP